MSGHLLIQTGLCFAALVGGSLAGGSRAQAVGPEPGVIRPASSVASAILPEHCREARVAAADILAARTAALWRETNTATRTCLVFRSRELRDGSGKSIGKRRLLRDYLQSPMGIDASESFGQWTSHPTLHLEGALSLADSNEGCTATLCLNILSREVLWWAFWPIDSESSFKFDANSRLALEYLATMKSKPRKTTRAERFLNDPQEQHQGMRQWPPSTTCDPNMK